MTNEASNYCFPGVGRRAVSTTQDEESTLAYCLPNKIYPHKPYVSIVITYGL